MKDKEDIYFNMFEEGGAHIYRINFHYVLFEIPLYGGEESFVGCYKTLELAKEEALKLT